MTSIEWLKEKLFYDFGFAFSDNMYKQAKEMHKKEMEQLPQQEICINCDEEKETHEICMDCISKLIKENHKEISDEEIDNAVVKGYENVGDEKLFPNHTDKDIWMNGFYDGAKWYREQFKKR